MRLPPIVLALGLGLALPALAQESPPPQQSDQPQAGQQTQRQQTQHQQSGQQRQQTAQLSADAHHVIGKEAMNQQGKEIGKVRDVLVGEDGRVQALVIDAKGKKRAVPWQELSMRADQLTINMRDQQLSQLPEYKGEKD